MYRRCGRCQCSNENELVLARLWVTGEVFRRLLFALPCEVAGVCVVIEYQRARREAKRPALGSCPPRLLLRLSLLTLSVRHDLALK